MNNFNSMKPFRFWCQKVLPLVYDDSLSYYELLCKVVDYINNIIKNENELNESIISLYNLFEELKKYVDNYFNNLDITDEINKKLDELAEDGTLANLLNAVFKYVPQGTTIDAQPICALKLNRGLYNSGSELSGKCYSITQGGCYAKWKGKDYYLCFTNPAILKGKEVSDGYRLELIDFTPKVFSGEPTPNNVKIFHNKNGKTHGNSISFYNGFFYYPTDNNKTISRIDINLTLEEKININLNDIGVNEIGAISYYNGYWWIGNSQKIGRFILSNNEFIFDNEIVTFEQLPYGTTQSLSVNKYGFARIVSFPNAILFHNVDGKISRIYNIPEYVDGNSYYVGYECEDLTLDDDFNVYFHTQGFETNTAMESFVRIFKTNLLKNQYAGISQSTTLTGAWNKNVGLAPPDMTQNIFVSNQVTGYGINSVNESIDTSVEIEYYLNKRINYNGSNSYSFEKDYSIGSYQNPFGFIQTAINRGNSPACRGCLITVDNYNDKPFGFVNFINCTNMRIHGVKNKNANNLPLIFDINIYYSTNVVIDNIRFEMNNTGKPKYLIGIYNSQGITLSSCEYTKNEYFTDSPYCIYINKSELSLNGTGVNFIEDWNINTPIFCDTGSILNGFELSKFVLDNSSRNSKLGYRILADTEEEGSDGTSFIDLKNYGWNTKLLQNLFYNSKKIYVSLNNSLILTASCYSNTAITANELTRNFRLGDDIYTLYVDILNCTMTFSHNEGALFYIKSVYIES